MVKEVVFKMRSSTVKELDYIMAGFPRGGLVVIGGRPGSGKTTFSARFLYRGAVDYGEPGVYASFAEDRQGFYGNMARFGFDFAELERKGLFTFLDLLTFQDVEASELILKNILESIVDAVKRLGAKRLVLDPFSAMAQTFRDSRELNVFIQRLLAFARQLGCTTILVEETSISGGETGVGMEEYLADAVILFRDTLFDGRFLRDLRIVKMRGVDVQEKQLIYTLKGGFRVFSPFKPLKIGRWENYKPPEDPSEDVYSTGVPSLDEAIGGYPRGSTVLLEVDSRLTNYDYQIALLMPLGASFLSKGRPLMVIPSLGVNWGSILEMTIGSGVVTDIEGLLRVFATEALYERKKHPCLVRVKGESLKADYGVFCRIEDGLTEVSGHPVLRILGADSLVAQYGLEETFRVLSLDVDRVASMGALSLIITKPIYPELAERISPVASIHLKLTREHGALLFYAVKPRTGIYVVEIDVSQGYPQPKLTPIT